MMYPRKISIIENGKERIIGSIHNSIFKKKIKGSVHILRKDNAIGIDKEAFDNEVKKCVLIQVEDQENNDIYTTTPSRFEKYGFVETYKPHRTQIFLPITHWKKINPNENEGIQKVLELYGGEIVE